MKPHFVRSAAYAAFALAVPLLAFWFGCRQGADIALMLDAIPRGGLSLFQLKNNQEGGSANLATLLESDVDIALVSAHRLEQHPLLPILASLSGLPLPREESMARLAAYRRSHPSPLRAEALAREPIGTTVEAAAGRASLQEAARKTDDMISSAVDRYAPLTRVEGTTAR